MSLKMPFSYTDVRASLQMANMQLSEDAAVHSECPHLLSNCGGIDSLWLVLVLLQGKLIFSCLAINWVIKVHTCHVSVKVMAIHCKRNL